ncbi:MAG: hypothetical protein LUE27_02025 [Clostridia bacterium]|nr:hypothetical protein [Clostridia bacterium]
MAMRKGYHGTHKLGKARRRAETRRQQSNAAAATGFLAGLLGLFLLWK